METPDQDVVSLQSFGDEPGVRLNTDASSESEQEQENESEPDTQPESIQETLELSSAPPPLDLVKFRIQQLENRRFILLEIQNIMKKAEQSSDGTSEERTSEDSVDPCELETIEKELKELLVKKEELEREGQEEEDPTLYKVPCGGVYMLPPPQQTQEDVPLEQRVETGPPAVWPTVDVDSLGRKEGLIQCPFCEAFIVTKTHSVVGDSAWLVCCLCFMLGCVFGCCLIPFFMNRLKDVHHHCPQCQARIHTCRIL